MKNQTAKLVVLDDAGDVFDALTFEVVDDTNPRELSTKYAVRTVKIAGLRVEFADGAGMPIDVGPNEGEGDFWTTPLAGLPVVLHTGGAIVVPPKALKLGLRSINKTELTPA